MRDANAPDLVVIGGGTAGFGAALAGARAGLSVTLIEGSAKVGGVMAFCPGMPWGGGCPQDRLIGGIFSELVERLAALDPPAAEKRPCALENFGPEIVYDHDIATATMFQMLEEAGVSLRLNTLALAPRMDGRRIAALEICDRRGPATLRPRFVIDASGDGDISARAGVPFTLGDGAGNMMAVSITFHMVGVDWAAAFAEGDPYFTRHAARGVASGRLHPDLARLYLMRGFHPGTVFCNSVHVRGVDGTNPDAVARATQEGRRRCLALAGFLRDEVPGFADARVMLMSPTAGVRETRRLEAVHRLRGEEIARGEKFADGIVACDNPVDDVMRGQSGAMTHEAALEAGDYYTIPFRSLMPREVENLLFAGRILCADPVAFASVRGMPQCMAMGQAAGTAAAMALREGLAVQRLDLAALVAALAAQGINRIGDRGEPNGRAVA